MIKKHADYIKDNPEGLWFKRKLYGWGWTPANWQGFAVVILYVVLVTMFALTIDEFSPRREIWFTFILPVAILTVTLIRICYAKGEKPKWQWGETKETMTTKDSQ